MSDTGKVHLVDDDAAVRDSLSLLLEASDVGVAAYESGQVFLDQIAGVTAGDCILTDVRMPGLDGLELLKIIKEKGILAPIIIMTGHADVPIAVKAMKDGAMDFLEKPFSDDALLQAVETALKTSQRTETQQAEIAAAQERFATLTAREKEVLEGLLIGHPNKTIAYDLGMSPRTVEVHRARIMQKMEARSLSALVRMSIGLQRT